MSKYFIIQELVPKYIYDYFGDKSIWFIDVRLWSLLDTFRDHFNTPITINNWHVDGKFSESGFRGTGSYVGSSSSQHKFGRAADLKFKDLTDYDLIRDEIKKNWNKFKDAGLTTIEADTPTWLHVDIRNTNSDNLLIVPYK